MKKETKEEWVIRMIKDAGLDPSGIKTTPLDEFMESQVYRKAKSFNDLTEKEKKFHKKLYDCYNGVIKPNDINDTYLKEQMKTIKEWLETLPEPYRTKALNNTGEWRCDYKVASLKEALTMAFTWGESPEGANYWIEAHKGNYVDTDPNSDKLITIQGSEGSVIIPPADSKKYKEIPFNQGGTEIPFKPSNCELAQEIWNEIKYRDHSSDSEVIDSIKQILNQHR